MLLGLSYEQQENKFNAVNYYKQAIRINPECFEAFEKMIKNNLMVDDEKNELISQLQFKPHQLWLKDYYVSKIKKELVSVPQGVVHFNVSQEDSLKLQIQFTSENYGVSPIRIRNVFESDQTESLRAPRPMNQRILGSPLLKNDETQG